VVVFAGGLAVEPAHGTQPEAEPEPEPEPEPAPDPHAEERARLQAELDAALARVAELEDRLAQLEIG
jgi:hypothetical protein